MTPTQQRVYDVLVENPDAPFDEIMRKSGYKSRSLVQLTLKQLEIDGWCKENPRREILKGMDEICEGVRKYGREIIGTIDIPEVYFGDKSALKKDFE